MNGTKEMIRKLRNGEEINLIEVADKLECFVQLIDDMFNDHYVDTLEWYVERCWELEEILYSLMEGESECGIN